MLNDGRSPGFGLTLVAETLNGFFLSAEMSSTPQGQGDPILPEDLGRSCAALLLEEVHRVRACSRGGQELRRRRRESRQTMAASLRVYSHSPANYCGWNVG